MVKLNMMYTYNYTSYSNQHHIYSKMQTECSHCKTPATTEINDVFFCKDCIYDCFIVESPPKKITYAQMIFAILEKNHMKKNEIAKKIEALKTEITNLTNESEKIHRLSYDDLFEIYNKK